MSHSRQTKLSSLKVGSECPHQRGKGVVTSKKTSIERKSNVPHIKYQIRNSAPATLAPLTAAVGLALSANSLQAATITVDSLADGVYNDDICTLRAAVYSVNFGSSVAGCIAGDGNDDTIVFDSELSGDIQLTTSDAIYNSGATIQIGASVTINGPGPDKLAVVGAGFGTGPVLYAVEEDSEISISGLTLRNGGGFDMEGYGPGGGPGGGILCHARTLELNDMVIHDNVSYLGGGGVWHETESSFIFAELTIHDSQITDNFTYFGSGGGVGFKHPEQSRLVIRNSTISDNTAWGVGGGLMASMPVIGYGFILTDNEFDNNSGFDAGGGVYLDSGYTPIFIANNTFSNNDADAFGRGGGLYLNESKEGSLPYTQIFLNNNSFISNTVGGNGGGAFIRMDAGEKENLQKHLSLSGNEFIDNHAENFGGGLKINTGYLVNVYLDNDTLTSNHADSDGGGLHLTTDTSYIHINELEATYNSSEESGGGLFTDLANSGLQADVLYLASNAANFMESQHSGGGAAFTASAGSVVSLSEATIAFNQAHIGGGVSVSGQHSGFVVTDSILTGNDAYLLGGGLAHADGASDGMTLSIVRSEISDNHSSVEGGGLRVQQTDDSMFNLINSTVSGNFAAVYGGGISLPTRASVNSNLKYSTIAFNETGFRGGGVYSRGSSCNVTNTIIGMNQASLGPDIYGFNDFAPCTLEHSLISDTSNASIVDEGNNLLNTEPMLESLEFNGGSTRTHRIDNTSPAYNAGSFLNPAPPNHDQRGEGYERLRLGGLDMGAYELQNLPDFLFRDRFENP